ncbi:GH1 family beta-glucosidase [soil metagenome]
MTRISRRQLGAALGASGLGLALSSVAAAPAKPANRDFPKGFLWGCGTSAYQTEGAVREDGRGASIWDQFTHGRGRIADGSNGDVACDSYRRFGEDVALLKGLGVGAYRFSIAWPRIFPNGRGQPNQKGVDHYKQVIDALLEAGIASHVTLFHWDLPAALPGGWRSRDTASAFADYAGYMAGQVGDRVTHFQTVNEIPSFVELGYGSGIHAPGQRLRRGDLNQVRHHALLAHGLGLQAIRAAMPGAKVGIADNPAIPVPVIESEAHVAAAGLAFRTLNAATLTTILDGAYPASWLEGEGANAPRVEPGDMAAIGGRLDFIGLNVYNPVHVRADAKAGFVLVPPPDSYPHMMLKWLTFGPEAAYWAVRHVSDLWQPQALYISENGCPSSDVVRQGAIEDTDRILYLRSYILQLQRAAAEGYPIKGYFLWSLLDNFEWAEGYKKRFGITHVDFGTQKRTPKLSAAWYRELIRRNAMV